MAEDGNNDDASSDYSDSDSSSCHKVDHFEAICSSDDLSIEELRRMTEGVSQEPRNSSFLHRVCMNKNVTLEIVEYLLHLYPSAIHKCLDIPDKHIIAAYHLHLACYNKDCPNEVVKLLLQPKYHYQLTHICHIYEDWGDTGDGECGGTPLHYYLSRTSNFDINIVKQLAADPLVLLSADDDTMCTPIHILMHNKNIGDMFDVVKYLVESNPSSLLAKDEYDQTPLNVACANGNITAKTIELLFRLCPDSVYQRNHWNALPIHTLCDDEGGKMDDEIAIDVLKMLLDAHPDSVSQIDEDEELPLHIAASNKSPAFCKVLVEAYPESVRTENSVRSLPFHNACGNGRPDTVEYLFGLYPESLHIRSGNGLVNGGLLPIHKAAKNPGENTADIIKFLLIHDPECLSKPVVSDQGGVQEGALPLHLSHWRDESHVTELLFDLYPEAILIRNGAQQLPFDFLRSRDDELSINPETRRPYSEKQLQRNRELLAFLSSQMIYARQAQDINYVRTPDLTGSLPLQTALQDNEPLGTIKLLVKGNPEAVNIPDRSEMHPLDIACWCSTVGIVKYLAELSPDRLNACDVNKNYPLHHACRGGNCEVISYLLETPMSSSISERNVDDKLPIQLFCEFVNRSEEQEDTPKCTETIWRLLTSYPETVLNW